MDTISHHVLYELYGCESDLLDDETFIEKIMVEAALKAGAEVRQIAFQRYAPQGVSGVVIISESHLTVHTWPENGYAAIDAFTCGEKAMPVKACEYLKEKLKAIKIYTKHFIRGNGEIKEGV